MVFPFVGKHIPKLEAMISFFNGEHAEFLNVFKKFQKIFSDARAEETDEKQNSLIAKLRDQGIYLVCLMRNHLQSENEGIYKATPKCLSKDELVLFNKLFKHH